MTTYTDTTRLDWLIVHHECRVIHNDAGYAIIDDADGGETITYGHATARDAIDAMMKKSNLTTRRTT